MKRIETDARHLHTGESVWAASSGNDVRVRTRPRSEHCDVAVVGAGVSGALVALSLCRAGLDVVVLDRRRPVTGSTLASTAMIQFEIDSPLTELADRIGAERAEATYLASYGAVSSLHSLIEAENIACAWKSRDALYLAGDTMGFRALRREADYRRKIGLPSAYLDAHALKAQFGFDRTAAIISSGAADLNPVRLAREALRAGKRYGSRLYAEHNVELVESSKQRVMLAAADGSLMVTAKKAVFATGYETIPQIPEARYDIISSWAIATQPLPTDWFWPTRCLVWEASDPYLYMRSTSDNRIVVGGEDEDLDDAPARDSKIERKSARLLEKLGFLLPSREFEIAYAWAGAFADSPTGLPYIAPVRGVPNAMAVLGCGGNGITFSMIAADIASAWARGKRHRHASLFE